MLPFTSERLESISFPALERVDGVVSIVGNARLSAVSMPKLTQASALALRDDPALATFSAGQLAQLETSLTVRGVALTRLDLPALSGPLTSTLSIEESVIEQVLLPELREVLQFQIELPSLRWLDLTRLERARHVRVRGREGKRDALPSLTLPSLQEVELLELRSLDALRTASLPGARRIDILVLDGNGQLESFVLPNDCALGSLVGSDNPRLCDYPMLSELATDPCDNPTYCRNNATQCF